MLLLKNSFALRTRIIALVLACCVIAVLVSAWRGLDPAREVWPVEFHRPAPRVALLEELAGAIVPAEHAPQATNTCLELSNVKNAVDERLAALAEGRGGRAAIVKHRYTLDLSRLADTNDCKAKALVVDSEVKRSWALFSAADSWRENAMNKSERHWQGRHWKPRLADLDTRNGWAMLSGCVRDGERAAVSGVCEGQAPRAMETLVQDSQLASELALRVNASDASPSGRQVEFRGKSVPVGKDVTLGFERATQERAGALTRCFTGHTPSCDVLPAHLRGQWHFAPGNIRAGAAAVVLVDVETGLVVAAAGSVSQCTMTNLSLEAEDVRMGGRSRTPLFRPSRDELCAQIPDRVGALGWLTQVPMLWLVGPGSSMKILAMLAGIEAGVVSPAQDSMYRIMLAQSHDPSGHGQLVPQRIARESAAKFAELLETFGFTADKRPDVLFGMPTGAQGWPVFVRAGFVAEPFAIDEALFQNIASAKRAGRNADAIFGSKNVAEYLKAYRLSISGVGSGDIRTSAWGLADLARRLALRAQGAESMSPTRMGTLEGAALEDVPLDFARPESVQRLIGMLGVATSSRVGGTAAGSCRRAFERCNADGHESVLFSKTGTSETGPGGEASIWVKDGGAGTPPAKLYIQVFRGADGRLYAGGAMTLRIRERPGSSRPELRSNSAAELLMLAAADLMTGKK